MVMTIKTLCVVEQTYARNKYECVKPYRHEGNHKWKLIKSKFTTKEDK
jgi:hypothetical protein